MKKKIFLYSLALAASMPVAAQETYENAKLTSSELNGTARYVGMGGAMEALGADISTIATNPAGLGLFRHSTISASGGMVSQYNGNSFDGANKTNASFDQVGGVYSMRTGAQNYLNFGFNYHKGRNFDYILNASGALNNASQNKQSYLKGVLGNEANGGFDVDKNSNGTYIGYEGPQSTYTALTWSQADYLYWNTVIPDANDGKFYYYNATGYNFNRKHTGYIGNYDFNISGNCSDFFYWGFTFGLKDVHYHGYSIYDETIADNKGNVKVQDQRDITGTGIDVSGGFIIRPIEDSPFRFGAYVKTPTWYDLTTKNDTYLKNNTTEGGTYDHGETYNSYDYKVYTPWVFGVSLGHTVGNYLALGATYEYEDFGSMKSRINDDDGYYDYYGGYYESSHNDRAMNNHTEKVLKGVSTLKLGLEFKPVSNFAFRLGYNYVSSMYDKSGMKDPCIASLGTSYQSTTDYVNWNDINRFTCGIGYTVKKVNLDLAYQYSSQSGTFYPFSSLKAEDLTNYADGVKVTNYADGVKVKNNRGQLLMTIGYRF